MPQLSRITVYPIKSFDGVSLPSVKVLAQGALADDRRLAVYEAAGDVINGKRSPLIHRIRAEFDEQIRTVRLTAGEACAQFDLTSDRELLAEFFSSLFAKAVEIREEPAGGFPDDYDSPGPTVISVATLETVAGWFPGLGVEEIRRRFRANLEIDGVEPFWEDRLYAEPGQRVPFRIGKVGFLGNNPCARCVVPTRDPATGEVWPQFARRFMAERERTLPAWAARARFDHHNRLAVNTLLADAGPGVLNVGDEVALG
jgi:uncharacterized protein